MKKRQLTSLFALAALLGASLTAAAQQKEQPQSGRTPVQPGAAATEPSANRAGRLTVTRFDRLGGTKIKTPQGEEIGKLEDIVFAPNGEALYGIVSFDKIPGIENKWYLLPWSSVQYRGADGVGVSQDGSLVLGIAKERIKNAPGFDKNEWPVHKNKAGADERAWPFSDVDRFYEPETRMTGRPINASARANTDAILRGSELRGRSVETSNGERFGTVSDVVIDPANGRVNYVVLSNAAGDRMIAVPWEALRAGKPATGAGPSANDALVLPFTRDRLMAAPEFMRGDTHWSEMSDPAYVGRVYEFYSVRPYWNQPMDRNHDHANPPAEPKARTPDKEKKDDMPPKREQPKKEPPKRYA